MFLVFGVIVHSFNNYNSRPASPIYTKFYAVIVKVLMTITLLTKQINITEFQNTDNGLLIPFSSCYHASPPFHRLLGHPLQHILCHAFCSTRPISSAWPASLALSPFTTIFEFKSTTVPSLSVPCADIEHMQEMSSFRSSLYLWAVALFYLCFLQFYAVYLKDYNNSY
jgi:hypothetical protein